MEGFSVELRSDSLDPVLINGEIFLAITCIFTATWLIYSSK